MKRLACFFDKRLTLILLIALVPCVEKSNSLKKSDRIDENGEIKTLSRVPEREGFFYAKDEIPGELDLRGMKPGTLVRSPLTGRLYRIPESKTF